MSPPLKFEDIGKEVRDLFVKNYNCGLVKVTGRSIAGIGGVGLKFDKETDMKSNQTKGFLEAKHTYSPWNLQLQHKWTTENVITSEIGVVDRFGTGTKFAYIPTMDIKSRKLAHKVAAMFHNDKLSCRIEAGLEESKPVLQPTVIATMDGWIAGAQFNLEASSSKMQHRSAIVGYYGSNFSLFGNMNEKGELYASLYQRLTESNSEAGFIVQLPYAGNDKTKLEFATAYNYDSLHRIQGKVNTQCQIELAFALSTGTGITVSIAGQVDGKNIKGGAHKVGLGVDINL